MHETAKTAVARKTAVRITVLEGNIMAMEDEEKAFIPCPY
jgi:hypothetical protein